MEIEEILLILNTLVYSDSFNRKEVVKGKSVYDFVLDNNFRSPKDAFFPKNEWDQLLDTVRNHPDIFSNIKLDNIAFQKGKEKSVTFLNGDDEVLVVFQGTGALEWHDNAAGGSVLGVLTPQQQKALDYVNKMGAMYPNKKLLVSGHSKGGNKAQVAALLSTYVTKAFSFDGQGMGVGFLLRYEAEIERNRNKIVSISNRSDFVNPLFQKIAGTDLFTSNESDLIDLVLSAKYQQLGYQHSPLSMFQTVNGSFRMRDTKGVVQDDTALFLGNMGDYFKTHMREDDFEIFTHFLMHLFEPKECSETFEISDIPLDFWFRLFDHMLAFGKKAGVKRADIELLFLNLYRFFPSLGGMKGVVLKVITLGVVGTNPLGSHISGKVLKRRLKAIVSKYNDGYSRLCMQEDIVRDFRYVMQEAIRACTTSNLDITMLGIPAIPTWERVEEELNTLGILRSHQDVAHYYEQILDASIMTTKQYDAIIWSVYQADRENAKAISKKVSEIQGYREGFLAIEKG